MAKRKYDDLISESPPGVSYNLVLYLAKNARDKNRAQYGSVCLNRFKDFLYEHYPQGKRMLIYEWNNDLESRWNIAPLRARIGKKSLKDLRPVFIRYYKICQKHGMLPKEMRIPKKVNKFCIKDIGKYSPSQVYIYITHLRHLWEEPYFVYNFLTLMDNYGLNVWSSYVIATRLSIYGTGHHILNIFAARMSVENTSVYLNPMFTLRDYFAAPEKKDKRKLERSFHSSWEVHKHTCNSSNYGSHKAVYVSEILQNVKLFNEMMAMKPNEGLKKIKTEMKVKGDVQAFLKSVGFNATKNYYEPWWHYLRVRNEGDLKYLLKVLRPAIHAYIIRKNRYGDATTDLHLKVKDKHLDNITLKKKEAALKRENFRSRFDDDKELVKVK